MKSIPGLDFDICGTYSVPYLHGSLLWIMEAICHETLSTLKGARRHDDVRQAEEEKRQGFGKEEEELAISLPFSVLGDEKSHSGRVHHTSD